MSGWPRETLDVLGDYTGPCEACGGDRRHAEADEIVAAVMAGEPIREVAADHDLAVWRVARVVSAAHERGWTGYGHE